jgi:anaerobic dimethyl sulfoxide reductase subunit C (anchor subunit)
MHAYRAILNLDESWLSREIAFYGLFFFLSLIYTWFWYKGQAENRGKVGWGLGVIGALAIFSSAMIYFIPSFPAWNSLSTVMMFFLTSLILGPLFVGLFLQIRKELKVELTRFSLGSIIAGIVVLAIYVFSLFGGLPEAVATAKLMTSQFIFWLRILTFVLAFFLLGMAYKNKGIRTASIYSVAFVVLAISEFLGRLQFYDTAVHL